MLEDSPTAAGTRPGRGVSLGLRACRTSLGTYFLWVLLFLGILAVPRDGCTEDGGRPGPSPGQTAREVRAAVKAADQARLERAVRQPGVDPYRVAGILWSAHLRFLRAQPDEAALHLRTIRALTKAVPVSASTAGLKALADTWAALEPEGLERERRLLAGYRTLRLASRKRDWAAALREVAALSDDLRRSPASLFALSILMAQGEALRALGRPGEAAAVFARTSRRTETLGWLLRAGDVARASAIAYGEAGDFPAALRASAEASRLFTRGAFAEQAAVVSVYRAEFMSTAGRHGEAVATARAALASLVALQARSAVARARLSLAGVLAEQGDLEAAYESGLQARRDYVALEDLSGVLRSGKSLALIMIRSGRTSEALTLFESLRQESKAPYASGQQALERARLLTNLGVLYLNLQMLPDAVDAQRQALALGERLGDAGVVALARGNLALVHLRMHQPALALEQLESLRDDPAVRRDADAAGATLVTMARALRQLGRTKEAEDALTLALEDWTERNDLRNQAGVHRELGDLHRAMKQRSRALEDYARADVLLERVGDRTALRAAVHHGAALAALQDGDAAGAMEYARKAQAIDRLHWRGLADDEALGLRLDACATSEVGVEGAWLWAKDKPQRRREAAKRAFQFSESGRLLLLATSLGNHDLLAQAQLPPALREEDRSTRDGVTAARRKILALAATTSSRPSDTLKRARTKLDQAWERRERVLRRIQRAARRTASIVYPEPISLERLQQGLAADEGFLGYRLQGERAFVLLVTREAAHLRTLGDSAPIRDAVGRYLRLISAPGGPEKRLATELHDALVRPLRAELANKKRLVIAPDGELAFLPFGALLRTTKGKARRLVEDYETVMVPSATVHVMLLQEARGRAPAAQLLAYGAPAYPASGAFLPLPASAGEVSAIGALFPAGKRRVRTGADASVRALHDDLAALAKAGGRLRSLHLACHAFIDPEKPRLSGLALAKGEIIDVGGVYRLRVPADLCVLSACESGRGGLSGAEGVLGFVRAFLFAGSSGVLASNWQVADEGTRRLMTEFYTRWRSGGTAAATALREAKLKVLHGGGLTAHPFYWAGFSLWGPAD